MMFVNLPARDLVRSRAFYTSLGYAINEEFSDPGALCVDISDAIHVILLSPEQFGSFVPGRQVIDPSNAVQVDLGLSAESRLAVDVLADKAMAAGATAVRKPDDQGFMYGRSFADPDGHIWEVLWVDMAAARTKC
ncbi:hypothetical protein VV02_05005 [Luteipulveratus mongoliensis]|uniref:VOC domain-containing protein n=2 Tax=Luteipulveratus mongoliensis TaxID=571913 RepID=A0A0K1JPL4_9MICO|nr:hypothetical protein VV02_05005 [Luteipulveratus mongoliensis]